MGVMAHTSNISIVVHLPKTHSNTIDKFNHFPMYCSCKLNLEGLLTFYSCNNGEFVIYKPEKLNSRDGWS